MAELKPVHIVGGGLAGSEAAWQAARLGVPVVLHEMRPQRPTEAHKTGKLAELVVIEGDPIERPAEIRNVRLVFRDGLGFDSAKLLESVEGSVGVR